MTITRELFFKAKGISKGFPGVQALEDVDISIFRNEIVGLSGENGAGKSTLMKIIAGVYHRDSGEMWLNNNTYSPKNYREGTALGISMVFQEQNLIPNIFGYENIFLSHEDFFRKKSGLLDTRSMIKKTKLYFEQFEINVNPAMPVSTYSFHQRQLVEIARAFIISELYGIDHPLILLDEPTAALSEPERELLFKKINDYSDKATFCLISHRLSEMMNYCNRIIVLKDGRTVGEVNPKNIEVNELHTMMIGRELSNDTYRVFEQEEAGNVELALEIKNLSHTGKYENINIKLHKGMVLGIGGLVGCGKRELGKDLFGVEEYDSGKIEIMGEPIARGKVPMMVKNKIGYIPAERKVSGIIEYLSVGWNISLPSIFTLGRKISRTINKKNEEVLIDKYIKDFRIKAKKDDMCISLSGGNQQKVVLAKWIAKNLDIIILDNPTRGIDVGAKEEIYSLIRDIVSKGVAVLMITDDLLELIGLSNRIIIMKEGKITSERNAEKGNKPTEKELIHFMV